MLDGAHFAARPPVQDLERVFSTPRPLLGYGPASASSSHEANDVEQRRTRWKPMSARFAA
jgi:hypothetical protein